MTAFLSQLFETPKLSIAPLSLEGCAHFFGASLGKLKERKAPLPLLVIPFEDKLPLVREIVTFFAPKSTEVLVFPGWDCLPYDRISPSKRVVAERLRTLMTLVSSSYSPRCVITTVPALLQRLPLPSVLQNRFLDLKKGQSISVETIQKFFMNNGYERAELVMAPGQYAIRGGLIDFFPSGSSSPIRVDFFGDEIDFLKSFEVESQRTVDELSACRILPATEVFLTQTTREFFRDTYRKTFGVEATQDPLYEAVSEGRNFAGQEHWLPYFYPKMGNLLTYTGSVSAFVPDEAAMVAATYLEEVKDYYQARVLSQKTKAGDGSSYRPVPPEIFYDPWKRVEEDLQIAPIVRYGRFKDPHKIDVGYVAPFSFQDNSESPAIFKKHLEEANRTTLIMAPSRGSLSQVESFLEHHGIHSFQTVEHGEALEGRKGLFLTVGPLQDGFQTKEVEVLSGDAVVGRILQSYKDRKRKKKHFFFEEMNFQVGDLLVHRDYGIGRYKGLQNVKTQENAHDCLVLEYDQEDYLYVPVENMDVLSLYGSGTDGVSLDRLGGGHWELRKAKAQKRIQEIAERLVALAARRQGDIGTSLMVDQEAYNVFCRKFPYVETEDQIQAIRDVIEDLGRGKPMDRLLCGDVGFGKTEIALRAAFVAAQAGYQVALVCPTTLLCAQHFQTFKKRFSDFPWRVESLSRLQAPADIKRIHEELKGGGLSIVIGTHALFSSKVAFHNLGLVIIDEEQHFGVKQKEHLKKMAEGVHVLSMSATPIPRSLQMAVAGIRELSLIATPPVDRLGVHTFVMPYDALTVREAILREFHRGGQVFYVCPRVADLESIHETLMKLIPEVSMVVAHGGLSPAVLTEIMQGFEDRRFQVLIATNIIESGLDIPNANTLIVHRSDLLGLSQLYQLRGRVGRSKTRGYAYFTYTPHKLLTESALKRLEVLQMLDEIGSGFSLASHDMDIRGMGNLVGEEQSGHVKEVGVSLYYRMLEEALGEAKKDGGSLLPEKTAKKSWIPQIHLELDVLIPSSYIEDLSLRLSFYRRLSEVQELTEANDLKSEMIDRFGALPEEVSNLFSVVHLKNLCKRLNLERIEVGPKGVLVSFFQHDCPYLPILLSFIEQHGGTIRLRPDNKMVILKAWKGPGEQLNGILEIFEILLHQYQRSL